MTWDNGRRLTSYTKGTDAVTFTYDGAGNRLGKTVNGTVTTYTYIGGRLYGQQTGNNTILFLYDDTGSLYGFTLNGTAYYYHKNIQGDVLGIYDSTGTEIVTYSYDAWGAPTGMTDTSTNSIGTLNPIRYRGYYCDAELGFYWLTTRFYDPLTCRFVNSDGVVAGVTESVQGYNLYAYCFNNPVNMLDTSGQWPEWMKAVGRVVGAVATNAVITPVFAVTPGIVAIPALTLVHVGGPVVAAAMPSKEKHYNRNQNQAHITNDASQIIESSDWSRRGDEENLYHRHETGEQGVLAKNNVKYKTLDGHCEVIINFPDAGAPVIVTDPFNVGTYNFGTTPGSHFVYDVLPYWIWGNSEEDSSIIYLWDRVLGA